MRRNSFRLIIFFHRVLKEALVIVQTFVVDLPRII
jgi:hypothetical protein